MDRAHLPRGNSRRHRRDCFQGWRSLGRGPDRRAFRDSFCSFARMDVYCRETCLFRRMGVYCGLLQSWRAMELLPASGSAVAVRVAIDRRRGLRLLESSASAGSKDEFAFLFFFEVLCVSWSGQLASVSFYNIFVFVRSLYAFLIS